MRVPAFLRSDRERYDGVRPVNVYLLRVLFLLVFVFVGRDSWTGILGHRGSWDPVRAAATGMWAACSLLSIVAMPWGYAFRRYVLSRGL